MRLLAIIIVISIAAGCYFVQPTLAADDDITGLLGDMIDQNAGIGGKCQQAMHSKSFDDWTKHYLAGKDAEADEDWKEVVRIAGPEALLRELLRQTLQRMDFLEGDPNNPRRGFVILMITLTRSTEKAVGKTSWRLKEVYDYAADTCEHGKDFQNAVVLRQKQLDLESEHWGKNNRKICPTLSDLADELISTKQYTKAQSVIDRLKSISSIEKDIRMQQQAANLSKRLETKIHVKRSWNIRTLVTPIAQELSKLRNARFS